jgi:lysophospholipase L1-like esterase
MKPFAEKALRLLKKAFLGYRDFCFIIGLTLLLWLALEALFGGLIVARNLVFYGRLSTFAPKASDDWRAWADSFASDLDAPLYFRDMDRLRMEWAPYVQWKFAPFASQYINIDANGHRRTEFPAPASPPRNAEPVRVWVMGGSTVWGTGARDSWTIPSLLGRELAERGFAAEVVNFGQSGYNSTQELIALELELREGRVPDFVIFYDGINDAYAAWQNGKAGLPHNEANRVREFNLTNQREFGRLAGEFFQGSASKIAERSNLIRIARKLGAGGLAGQSKGAPGEAIFASEDGVNLAKRVMDLYAANLSLADGLKGEYGFETLFYWQPSVYDKTTLTDYEYQMPDYPTYEKTFRAVSAALRQRGPVLGVEHRFQDISDIFESDPAPRFIDFCHVSEAGNALIAERMAEDLAPLIEQRLTTSPSVMVAGAQP